MKPDLFAKAQEQRRKPLAAEIRPQSLDELVGQQHILGPNGPLWRRVRAGRLVTVILFGPPGVGETTIARAIGQEMKKEFRSLHPANSNVSDIKAVAQEAQAKDLLVFIDEIHRFSSAQQDYLLDLTETGTFDLIAATTGNPYHVLTPCPHVPCFDLPTGAALAGGPAANSASRPSPPGSSAREARSRGARWLPALLPSGQKRPSEPAQA